MVLIVGMARSGVAAAKLLQSRGKSVFATDSGNAPLRSELDSLGIPYEAGGHTAARFLEAEEIVMSPGVPLDIPPLGAARRKGIPIVSEIEVAFRYLQGDIVAITGSNGKTTTTTLIGEVLNATGRPVQVGGNIGTALSSLVESSRPTTINVVEVSSFQLDGIRKFRPRVAVLTQHHARSSGSVRGFQSLSRIQVPDFRKPEFFGFRHSESRRCRGLSAAPPDSARQRFFSQRQPVADGAYRSAGTLYLNGKPVMPAADVTLRGAHNIDNVLAAMTVAGLLRCFRVKRCRKRSEFSRCGTSH